MKMVCHSLAFGALDLICARHKIPAVEHHEPRWKLVLFAHESEERVLLGEITHFL
jgi:hypothetical protein